jgi:hypothetical protein
MRRSLGPAIVAVATSLASATLAQSQGGPPALVKPPWGALVDIVGAGEIVLGRVCLPAILEHKPTPDLAVLSGWCRCRPTLRALALQTRRGVWRP